MPNSIAGAHAQPLVGLYRTTLADRLMPKTLLVANTQKLATDTTLADRLMPKNLVVADA